jgi:hypothetical protein
VTTSTGKSKKIADVQVGDAIQTISSSGSVSFADVVFVVHESNSQRAKFVNVEIANGKILKVTPDHLVLTGVCSAGAFASSEALVKAESIKTGDCVLTPTGAEQVVRTSVTEGEGVYTVVTTETSGLLVVDGIVASSFGFNHAITNTYYNLHRVMYHAGGASLLGSQLVRNANAILGDVAVRVGRLLRFI